jgi:hypothetical protein
MSWEGCGRMEMAVAWFKVLSRLLAGGTDKNHEKLQLRQLSQMRLELRTFQIQARSITVWVNLLSRCTDQKLTFRTIIHFTHHSCCISTMKKKSFNENVPDEWDRTRSLSLEVPKDNRQQKNIFPYKYLYPLSIQSHNTHVLPITCFLIVETHLFCTYQYALSSSCHLTNHVWIRIINHSNHIQNPTDI